MSAGKIPSALQELWGGGCFFVFRVGLLSRGYGNVSAEQPTAGESELQRIHDGVQTRPDVIHKFDAAQPTLTFGPLLAGENEGK